MADKKAKVVVSKDGPYMVSGGVPLDVEMIAADSNGVPQKWEKGRKFPSQGSYALCRCGQSRMKPYCDGSHASTDFCGTETASRDTYAKQNQPTIGPDLILNDAEKFCSIARFCHRAGDAWTLTEHSDDPEKKKIAIQEAFDCPSGRLVACKGGTGEPMEPDFQPSISITQDTAQGVSGPIWVKGGILIESYNGEPYEIRNRVTLCRCGASKNKPFCDGTHCEIKFNDGDASINEDH